MIKAIHFSPRANFSNRGQCAEYDASFELTGTGKNPDNIKGTEKPDFYYKEYGIQCKSARATVCNGTNYLQYIMRECKCDLFCFVLYRNQTLYLMDKNAFLWFCHSFSFVDTGSDKKSKIRIKKESRAMMEWFENNS